MANDKSKMNSTLHNQSKKLEKALKKYALPNKDTGYLDTSIKSAGYENNGDSFKIKCEAVYYAKYLNGRTDFINKAIDEVLPAVLNDIVKTEVDYLMQNFTIGDTSTKYKNRR